MKKSELVYQFIYDSVKRDDISKALNDGNNPGVTASDIQNNLGIVRNNASSILNQLCKENKIIKIQTRPVAFIAVETLVSMLGVKLDKNIYTSSELKDLVQKPLLDIVDPFSKLLGFNGSLAGQISQAKAAIVYPPKGLHTLLLGESGVGKTTFASAMHEYGMQIKQKTAKEFPFITFNCADYFNNPQLLLSQLFGHIKSAFTGAEREKIGLVEQADGGILFLDEIHRLPPEGQEMLFYLMDKGEYSRLGESGIKRKSNLLIIAATTEDPNGALLATFLRRIPVNIILPPFAEKSISEKVEIIEHFLRYEAINLNKALNVAPEVIKALAINDFRDGNIGQIRSEIKLLCAKAFLQHLQTKQVIKLEYTMLSKDIREGLFNYSKLAKNITNYLDLFAENIIVSPNKDSVADNLEVKNDIYDLILNKLNYLTEKGLETDRITNEIGNEIVDYFSTINKHFQSENNNLMNLYKFVSKEIVDETKDLISFAEIALQIKFNYRFIFGLALHIQALLQRIGNNSFVPNEHLSEIKSAYPKEFSVACELVMKISKAFNIMVPEDEKGFLALLLLHNKIASEDSEKIGVIISCHGDSTASSIANVCNALLNTSWIKAIDMPLDSTVEETYSRFKAASVAVNRGRGIILLADMGSLMQFGERFTKETDIETKTLGNVSTPLALEVLRLVLYKLDDITTVCNTIKTSRYMVDNSVNKKKPAIISVCATGQGASVIAENVLNDLLNNKYKQRVELIVLPIDDVKAKLPAIREKYNLVAVVGNIDPQIGTPYFPINQLLQQSFRKKLRLLLDDNIVKEAVEPVAAEQSIYDKAKQVLEQYVKYINPKLAVASLKTFIKDIGYESVSEASQLDLIIHMGCMLDRCINRIEIKFDNMLSYKNQNAGTFETVRNAVDTLSDEYKVKISDHEVCYIVKIITTQIK